MTEHRHTVVDDPVSRREYDAMIDTFAGERREIVHLLEALPKVMSGSVEEGVRKALVSATVLDALHDHFAKRTRSKLAEWVFDRLTTVVASLVLAAALTWYVVFRGDAS